MKYHEINDIWRLYRREWVTVHTITQIGADMHGVHSAAMAWYDDNLKGRVREADVRYTLNSDTGSTFWAHIEVFKDNLKGEFKQFSTAEMHAEIEKYEEYTIVPRNSKTDHELRNYGVKLL